MNINELGRVRNNEKVKQQAELILEQCRAEGFTMSDMKDLSVILPQEIRKALISKEEKQCF